MTTELIANTFPDHWVYGEYEQRINQSLIKQMNQRWPNSNNLIVGTTWMGPATEQQIQIFANAGRKFENLVITSTVDAALNFEVYPLIDRLVELFGITQIFRVGNFDGDYEFNIFAVCCKDYFKSYNTQDLVLQDLRWRYCAYNRKPYPHRVQLVAELVAQDLETHGVITLGRAFPSDPDHGLYRSIGEKHQDYVEWGHWYEGDGTAATPHEIPHDLFSLHNWTVWQHHFLHIVGATAAHNEPDTFVNQINFKPLIGMRPFVINGQTKQYRYLRQHGFRTFNQYWPQFDVEQGYYGSNDLAICLTNLVKWLVSMSDQEIMSMYTDMLPDLEHNRLRWYEWANEQSHKVEHLF
jgi:hypothetical protein